MAKFIAGYILGLFLGLAAMVSAQHTTASSGTWATPPGNLMMGIDTTTKFTQPTSFVFVGKGPQELLRISMDGTVTYQGRVLGTDKEIWDGLRVAFNPWRICEELEEHVVPWTAGGQP